MAQVPYDEGAGPTVQPDIRPPDDYQHIDARPEAFGAATARGMQELGAGAVKASNFYGQIAADDVMNNYVARTNKRLYGDPDAKGPDGSPDTGYFGKKGADQIAARAQLQKDMDADLKEFRGQLSTPESQFQFDSYSRRYRLATDGRIGESAERAYTEWGIKTQAGTLEQAQGDAARHANDDAVFNGALENAKAAAVKTAQLQGLTGDAIKASVDKATNALWKMRVETIGVNDPAGAFKMAQEHQAELGTEWHSVADGLRDRAAAANADAAANTHIANAKASGATAIAGDGKPHISFGADHAGPVSFAGVQPHVVNGVNQLSAMFGPITLNSANPGDGKGHADGSEHYDGDAVDVSIRGMDDRTLSRLITTARAAGFTGFGIGATHLHLDMRHTLNGAAEVFGDAYAGPVAGGDVAYWTHRLNGGWTGPDGQVAAVAGGVPNTRGFRNNNPGNIEAGSFASGQAGYSGSDGRFAKFETREQGMAALDALLQSYGRQGLSSPMTIAARYAPNNENDTAAYAKTLASALGVSVGDAVNMSDPSVRAKLAKAIVQIENGGGGGVSPVVAGAAGRLPSLAGGGSAADLPVVDASLSTAAPSTVVSPPPPAPASGGQAPAPNAPPSLEQIKAAALEGVQNDPRLNDREKQIAAARISQEIAQEQIIQQATEKAKKEHEDKQANAYLQRIHTGDVAGIVQQIVSDQYIADPRMKEWLINIAENKSKEGEDEWKIKGGKDFEKLYAGVVAYPGDPTRITDKRAIYQAASQGRLTTGGADKLISTMSVMGQSDEDAGFQRTLASMKQYAKQQMSRDGENAIPGVPQSMLRDPKGENKFYGEFVPALERQIKALHADGKDPTVALDLKNIDELIDSVYSKDERLKDRLSDAVRVQEPANTPLPPAPPNVRPEVWTPLVSQTPVQTNGQPVSHFAWGKVLETLATDPSPQTLAMLKASAIWGRMQGVDYDQIAIQLRGEKSATYRPEDSFHAPAGPSIVDRAGAFVGRAIAEQFKGDGRGLQERGGEPIQ